MRAKYDQLVEDIRACSAEEKQELKFILERSLADERRQEILNHYQESRDELKEGRLTFSSQLADLKRELEHE